MTIFIKIIKKLYWLGMVGLVGSIFNIKVLELFYLFFLFGILDFILSFIIESKSNSDLKFLFQNLGMLVGIPYIYMKNRFSLPNINNYQSQNKYILPFKGSWIVASGGIDKKNSHSWGICNQRYAYDFFIMVNGKTYQRKGTSVTDYYCYDQEIIAPANGIIVELKNQYFDTPVSQLSKIQCRASDIRGNYITIKHSSGEYSMIAHLKKNSFLVEVGDKVIKGQKLARCGNSGNSSEPHVHFQVQQGQNFLYNASIPVYFDEVLNSSNEKTHYLSAGQLVRNNLN